MLGGLILLCVLVNRIFVLVQFYILQITKGSDFGAHTCIRSLFIPNIVIHDSLLAKDRAWVRFPAFLCLSTTVYHLLSQLLQQEVLLRNSSNTMILVSFEVIAIEFVYIL